MRANASAATPDNEPTNPTTVPAGRVTALLEQLARAPELPADDFIDLRPGAKLGRFEIQHEIGRGGFGVVYEARDEVLGRPVALKVLRPSRRRGDPGARTLVEEAEAVARLQHANIVSVFDVGSHEGVAYVVLELLRGETLAARLRRGPLGAAEALRVATEVARALGHAHGRGVVHRDLKPANVFVGDDGAVKVLDFGLSRLIGGRSAIAGGTPGYMPPEQLRGAPEDSRVDVYALGAVIREMLTGLRASDDDWGTRSRADPRIPRELAPLLARMAAEDPARRPRDGAEVEEALHRAARQATWRRRDARLAAVAAGIVVASVAGWTISRNAAGGIPHSTRPPPGEDGRIGVVVTDVDNRTGDPALDPLGGMVLAALEQSPTLRVIPRRRALELLGSRDGPAHRIDRAGAARLAREGGLRLVLEPRLERRGGGYALELVARESERGTALHVARTEGAAGDVTVLVDRAASALRLWAGEARDDVAKSVPVGRAVTRDLGAYALYVRNEEMPWSRGDLSERRRLLEGALQLDPAMAIARYELALIEVFVGTTPRARIRELLAQAVRDAGALAPKERLLIRALDAWTRLDVDGALELYRAVLARHPDEAQARALAAQMLWLDGGFRPEAIALVDELLAMDAQLTQSWELVYRILCSAGRCDEALARARARAEARPSYQTLRPLFAVHLYRGERDALLDVAERIGTIQASVPWQRRYPLATAHYLRDEYEAADEVVASVADVPPLVVAFMRVAEGRWREAREILSGDRHGGYPVPDEPGRAVLLLAGIGSRDEHRTAARALCAAAEDQCGAAVVSALLAGDVELARECLRAAPSTAAEIYRPFVDAWDLARAGKGAAAVARARAAARPDVVQGQLAALLTADICYSVGEWRCVVEGIHEYRRAGFTAPAPFKDAFHAWTYPRSLLRTALAYDRLGNREAAREALTRLLRIWKHADPGLPWLEDARRLAIRLEKR
jgi:tetratricopeptide (TPR) repeat protein